MTLEHSECRPWAVETQALRAGRRGRRRGWLTTPRQLLERAKTLDPLAISGLYASYRRPIVNFLRQRGAPSPLAEDVTQDFLLGVWSRGDLAKLRPEGSFGAWLRSGALHQLYNDQMKANADKRRLDAPQVAELRLEWEDRRTPAADRLLDHRDRRLLFDNAWARLKTQYASSGRELLFEHLKRTLSRDERVDADMAADATLCQHMGISANHLAVMRNRLKTEEFRAALLAELKARRSREKRSGNRPPGAMLTIHEELRALLDDAD